MTATCHQFDHARYVELVHAEIDRLAEVIAAADPVARVPTCPDWSIRELAEHVGGVHRWAEHHVANLAQARVRASEVALETPEDPRDLAAWLERGADLVAATFAKADPDAPVWAWGSDKHARFWFRRMLHETTVHRADAEIALGRQPQIAPDVVADGVDEFLDNLPHAVSFAPRVQELRGEGETLQLRCDETQWMITLSPDAFAWNHRAEDTLVTVEGSPAELLLFAYGRRKATDSLNVTGRRDVLQFWVERSSI